MKPSIRQQRKEQHLSLALVHSPGPWPSGFDDVHLIHQALSDLSMAEIDPSVHFCGKKLAAPFLIEAITGGTQRGKKINQCLARAAGQTGIAMAVGSQTIAIENKSLSDTFAIVREHNPDGVILANVGATVPVQVALEAVEMIAADGIQVHLNLLQELVMEEGDRSFSRIKENIAELVAASPVPVIVKEVGFGLSKETAESLFQLGVRCLDTGGAGGTNFAAIENMRRSKPLTAEWHRWGIPTACSLLECLAPQLPLQLIASGGIDNGIKAAKAIALGAEMAGAALVFLQSIASDYQEDKLVELINSWIADLKMVMLLTGAQNIVELRKKPLIITGFVRQWAESRGIAIKEQRNTVLF